MWSLGNSPFHRAWDNATAKAKSACAKLAVKSAKTAAGWASEKAKQLAEGASRVADNLVNESANHIKNIGVAIGQSFTGGPKGLVCVPCLIKDAKNKLGNCWGKATDSKKKPPDDQRGVGTQYASKVGESTLKEIINTSIKSASSSAGRKEVANIFAAKTFKGKASRILNVIDNRQVLKAGRNTLSNLFDGRRSLKNTFFDGAERLYKQGVKKGTKSAGKTFAKEFAGNFAPKQLGISAAIEFGSKIIEKKGDLSKLTKKDGIEVVYGAGTGAVYGAAGAAIGTLIPVPIVGTVVGFFAGVAIGMLVDHFFKSGTIDFLDCMTS